MFRRIASKSELGSLGVEACSSMGLRPSVYLLELSCGFGRDGEVFDDVYGWNEMGASSATDMRPELAG